jgi:hypothetical protein
MKDGAGLQLVQNASSRSIINAIPPPLDRAMGPGRLDRRLARQTAGAIIARRRQRGRGCAAVP